jgi:hypothetical protein
MKMTGMRTTVMSTRPGLNQSTIVPCDASIESLFIRTIIIVQDCVRQIHSYVINIAMILFEICLLMCVTIFGVHMNLLYILFCA